MKGSITLEMDRNGNKIARISVPGRRGFSIQTNGNLPKTHRIIGDQMPSAESWKEIRGEIAAYVAEYGTANQKAICGIV